MFIRNAHSDFSIKSSSTSEGGIQRVRSIRRSNHKHLDFFVTIELVQTGQQLSHDTPFHFLRRGLTFWCNRVDLVQEQHARRVRARTFKHVTNLPLRLARNPRDHFGRGDIDHRHIKFTSDGAREQRLAATRGSVE